MDQDRQDRARTPVRAARRPPCAAERTPCRQCELFRVAPARKVGSAGLGLVILAGILLLATRAQAVSSPIDSVLSHSGQFIIQAERSSPLSITASDLATNRSLVRLEPALMGVSCERIKQILLRELGNTAPWQGRIYLKVRPVRAPSQTIALTSERFKNGWQYQVELPDPVERDRYIRAIVQVVLIELANRGSRGRRAEIPLWLSEGLSQRLLASREMETILPPPRRSVNGLSLSTLRVTERMGSPLEQARKQLRGRPPLSFDQLSWQDQDELSGPAADLYRGSAQLFVGELLRLPDGRACLAGMLARLPQYHNWQLAFLEAFRSHFERPLDVEKWWALCCAPAPDRAEVQNRTTDGSWSGLDQALRTPAPVRPGTTPQPERVEVSLQTIVREWDRAPQTEALSRKLQELDLLRPQLSRDLAVLVQEYCQVLEVYLQNQNRTKPMTFFGRRPGLSHVAMETLQRLDALDARRETLRPPKAPAAAVQTTSNPAPPR